MTIINTWFTRCEAVFGGACYIYSNSETNEVSIEHCKFKDNKVNGNKNSIEHKQKGLFGGSTLFMTARNADISNSSFVSNKEKYVAFKIYNRFDDDGSAKLLDENDSSSITNSNTISIINCDFQQNDESTETINYISGNSASEVEINNCKFKGKLVKGSHYIEGNLL